MNARVAKMVRIGMALLSAHWQSVLAYRGTMLVQTVQKIMMPTVLLAAWLSVARKSGTSYEEADYLLYFICIPIVTSLTSCSIMYTLPAQIRDGSLSRDLLKPLHPLWTHVFEHLASNAIMLLYLMPAPLLLGLWFHDRLPAVDMSPRHLTLFLGVFLLAIILRFVMGTLIALAGFWIEHVETLNLVFNAGLWAMLGGMIVPVETFPPTIRVIANALPYRYTLSFPLEVLRGHLPITDLAAGIATGISWTVVLIFLGRVLWLRGLLNWSAYGG
ncbi:MAG: ABC-2 family transporter protein [Candidatus Riflebacteria bacterium]|nr:ABC-2 family transporter protein [Candidatus Riflebacteria bacterium]